PISFLYPLSLHDALPIFSFSFFISFNPLFKILTLALISRSCSALQFGHVHSLMFSAFLPLSYPQLEQICDVLYGLTMINFLPYIKHLYSSVLRNRYHDCCEMLRARL